MIVVLYKVGVVPTVVIKGKYCSVGRVIFLWRYLSMFSLNAAMHSAMTCASGFTDEPLRYRDIDTMPKMEKLEDLPYSIAGPES